MILQYIRNQYIWFIISMEISITLRNTFNQTSIFFQKLVQFPHQSDKGSLAKCQLKMLGMVQKKVYQATLNTLRFGETVLHNYEQLSSTHSIGK